MVPRGNIEGRLAGLFVWVMSSRSGRLVSSWGFSGSHSSLVASRVGLVPLGVSRTVGLLNGTGLVILGLR